MRKATIGVLTVAMAAMAITFTMAQPPGGRGGRGGPGGRGPGGPPRNPVREALDADGDHEISAEEIENAVAALKKLDRNGDGKLTFEDLQPTGPGGPRRRGPGGGDRGARGGPNVGDAAGFVERVLGFDENKDGKVAKEELPERMQGILDRHDANKDGWLDKAELEQVAAQFGSSGNARGAEGRGAGGRGPASRGGPGGRGPGGRGPGGPGGPPSPEQFVEHAMTFDADEDGKLNRDELRVMAEQFARRGPPGGGRGGFRGRGGPGGGRGGRTDDQQRPQRPDTES